MENNSQTLNNRLAKYNKYNIPAQQLPVLEELQKEYRGRAISIYKITSYGFNEGDICAFLNVQEYVNNEYGNNITIKSLIMFYKKFFNSPGVDEDLLNQKICTLIDAMLNNNFSNRISDGKNIYVNTIIKDSITIADKLRTTDIDMVIDYINGDNIYY